MIFFFKDRITNSPSEAIFQEEDILNQDLARQVTKDVHEAKLQLNPHDTIVLYRATGRTYINASQVNEVASGLRHRDISLLDWFQRDLVGVIDSLPSMKNDKRNAMVQSIQILQRRRVSREVILAVLHTNFNTSPWLSASQDPVTVWDTATTNPTSILTLEVPKVLTVNITSLQDEYKRYEYPLWKKTNIMPQRDLEETAVVGGIVCASWVRKIQAFADFFKEHKHKDPLVRS